MMNAGAQHLPQPEGKGAFRGRDVSAGSREANRAPPEVSPCSRKGMYITQGNRADDLSRMQTSFGEQDPG